MAGDGRDPEMQLVHMRWFRDDLALAQSYADFHRIDRTDAMRLLLRAGARALARMETTEFGDAPWSSC